MTDELNPTPKKQAHNRLREVLARYGARTMTNTQLLAVALNLEEKAAHAILSEHSAEAMPALTLKQWADLRGVGSAQGARMSAAFALASRVLGPKPEHRERCGSPQDAYNLVRDLRFARREHLVGLYLDAQNYLIRRETITIGSLNTTRTHPREILQPAILGNALSFVLAHNHPSGSLEPSREDLDFTRSIARAAELMGIGLSDHLIVSARGYVSLKERGVL